MVGVTVAQAAAAVVAAVKAQPLAVVVVAAVTAWPPAAVAAEVEAVTAWPPVAVAVEVAPRSAVEQAVGPPEEAAEALRVAAGRLPVVPLSAVASEALVSGPAELPADSDSVRRQTRLARWWRQQR